MQRMVTELVANKKGILVQTVKGLKMFAGVSRSWHEKIVVISLEDRRELKTSLKHKFLVGEDWVNAGDLKAGEQLTNGDLTFVNIISVEIVNEPQWLYDLIDVDGGNAYITNGVVSHNCEFLSSDALLISSLKLTLLKESEPVIENMGFKFWKTEAEIGGAGKTYLVGIDPATGNGSDFTVIDIVEFPSLEQIGQFRTNHVNIPLIYAKIKWILKYLTRLTSRGCAEVLWSFERNGVGEALVAMIQNDDDSDGGVYIDNTELFCDARDRLGCYTTGKSKLLTCMQLKNLVEKAKGLTLHSDITIYELKHFVASGGTYQAKPGATDDCVMALCVIIKLLNRLSSYNDDAKSVVYEQMSPDADIKAVIDQGLADDEPVPFAFM